MRVDWDRIMEEAEKVANQLIRRDVDLDEAQKLLDFYVQNRFNEDLTRRYLEMMADNPPPRSKKSPGYFRGLRDIWKLWRPEISPRQKAMAWGWGVRLAKVRAREGR